MRNSFALCCEVDVHFLGFDAREHFVDFQINDVQQLRFTKRMKHDDLVQSVEELGFKDPFRFIENLVAHRIVIVSLARCAESHHRLLLQQISADV